MISPVETPTEIPRQTKTPLRHLYMPSDVWSLCGLKRRPSRTVEFDGKHTSRMCVVCLDLFDQPQPRKRWWQFWRTA